MRTSALWSGLTASLTNPTAVAAFASVGMHAILGVTLPALPFFASGDFSGGEPVVSSGVSYGPLPPELISSLPAVVRNPSLLRTDPSTLLGAFPSTTQTGLPGFSTLPQAPVSPQRSSSSGRRSSTTNQNQRSASTSQSKSSPVILRYGNQSRTNPSRSTNSRSNPSPSRPAKEKNVRDPIANPIPVNIEIGEKTPFPGYDGDLFQNDTTIAAVPERALDSAASTPGRTPTHEQQSLQASLQSRSLAEQAEVDENHAQFRSRHPEPKNITIAGSYPANACYLKGAEALTVVYGATLQMDGSAENLSLIGGSPIREFVRQARQAIRNHRFEAVEQPTAAAINVSFNRDNNSNCPAATQSQPTESPPPTPRSRPKPQPSPSPTSEASPTAEVISPEVKPNSDAPSPETPSAVTEPTLVPQDEDVNLVLPETEATTLETESSDTEDAIEPETNEASPEAAAE